MPAMVRVRAPGILASPRSRFDMLEQHLIYLLIHRKAPRHFV